MSCLSVAADEAVELVVCALAPIWQANASAIGRTRVVMSLSLFIIFLLRALWPLSLSSAEQNSKTKHCAFPSIRTYSVHIKPQ
jgi:hypothetical protein